MRRLRSPASVALGQLRLAELDASAQCAWHDLGIRALRLLLVALLIVLAPIELAPIVDTPMAYASTAGRAWVQVSVATLWHRPTSPQPIDAPALEKPVRITDWLSRLTVADRLALGSRINTQVLLDQQVRVIGHRGRWSKVEAPDQRGSRFPNGITGWLPSVQISHVAPIGGPRELTVGVRRAWLHGVADSAVGRRRFLVSYDTELPVVGSAPGYDIVGLPGGEQGAIRTGALDPVGDGRVSGAVVVAAARRFIGLPYLWGGTSGFGFDCSGLVYAIYARYGLYLPRDAADQQHAGTRVALDKLQPGDLLFFGRPAFHVAIYAGGGRVIDSPYSGASVELIAMTSIPVWDAFSGAIRVAHSS